MAIRVGDAIPWWLYSNDLELARHQQHDLIARTAAGEQQLAAISILSYLGDYEGCDQWLERVAGCQHVLGQQSRYRILRYLRDANPWRALLPPGQGDSLAWRVEQRIEAGQPVLVDVVGGIGDQLESSAMLRCIRNQLSRPGSLWIRPLGQQAGVVRQLLEQVDDLPLAPAEGLDQPWRITAPWFRFWLGTKGIQERILRPLLMDGIQSAPGQVGKLLVCWRTKPDPDNPLSSFSRSLSFPTVLRLYRRWAPALLERGWEVLDLSDYSSNEVACLPTHQGWLRLVRPMVRNLQDTRALIQACESVATVDTSLVHLTALCDRDVHLLLPRFPDERWLDLLGHAGIYQQRVTPHRQLRLHHWQAPLASLEAALFGISPPSKSARLNQPMPSHLSPSPS